MYWTGSTPRTSATANSRNDGNTKSSAPRANADADLGGLLTLERRIDGELALALERHALAVQAARQHHPAQQLSKVAGRQADIGVADRRAVGCDEAERLASAPRIDRGQRFSSNAGDAESIGDAAVR